MKQLEKRIQKEGKGWKKFAEPVSYDSYPAF